MVEIQAQVLEQQVTFEVHPKHQQKLDRRGVCHMVTLTLKQPFSLSGLYARGVLDQVIDLLVGKHITCYQVNTADGSQQFPAYNDLPLYMRAKLRHEASSKEERLDVLRQAGLVDDEGKFLTHFADRRKHD
jgi:hypothetical protein